MDHCKGERGRNPRSPFPFEPFEVAITTATAGAGIRYTTDGSKPTATLGTLYTPAQHDTVPRQFFRLRATRR
jgi:hypothetical protein